MPDFFDDPEDFPDPDRMLPAVRRRAQARRRRRWLLVATVVLMAGTAGGVAFAVGRQGRPSVLRVLNQASPSPSVNPAASPTRTPSPAATSPPSPLATGSASGFPLDRVDWAHVDYEGELGCSAGSTTPVVWQVTEVQPPGATGPIALVLVGCRVGAGTSPAVLIAYGGAADATHPHLLQVVFTPGPPNDPLVRSFTATGASIAMTGLGYTDRVPRCCPNVTVSLSWIWTNGRYQRQAVSAITNSPAMPTSSPSS